MIALRRTSKDPSHYCFSWPGMESERKLAVDHWICCKVHEHMKHPLKPRHAIRYRFSSTTCCSHRVSLFQPTVSLSLLSVYYNGLVDGLWLQARFRVLTHNAHHV